MSDVKDIAKYKSDNLDHDVFPISLKKASIELGMDANRKVVYKIQLINECITYEESLVMLDRKAVKAAKELDIRIEVNENFKTVYPRGFILQWLHDYMYMRVYKKLPRPYKAI